MDSMEWFRQGGPVMYALLICSLAAAVIGIERFSVLPQGGSGQPEADGGDAGTAEKAMG